MFPFFEPNLFPLLEGAAHFLYLLTKRKGAPVGFCRLLPGLSPAVAFVSLSPFTPFADLQLVSR